MTGHYSAHSALTGGVPKISTRGGTEAMLIYPYGHYVQLSRSSEIMFKILNTLRKFSQNASFCIEVCARAPSKVWSETDPRDTRTCGNELLALMNERTKGMSFCFRRHSTTQFKFKCMRNHSLMPRPKSTIAAKHPPSKNTNFPTWYLNVDG